jgi:hypothetical protein
LRIASLDGRQDAGNLVHRRHPNAQSVQGNLKSAVYRVPGNNSSDGIDAGMGFGNPWNAGKRLGDLENA